MTQSGSRNQADTIQSGRNNVARTTQSGAGGEATTTQNGQFDESTINQTGGSVASVTQNGTANRFGAQTRPNASDSPLNNESIVNQSASAPPRPFARATGPARTSSTIRTSPSPATTAAST